MISTSNHKSAVLLLISFILHSTKGVSLGQIASNIDSALVHPFVEFSDSPPFKDEYDFIIVGCGAAATALANRLTEVSSFQVLCVEAGEKESAIAEIPFFLNAIQKEYFWDFRGAYQERICQGFKEETCKWPEGRGIGGGTVINVLMYTRANRKDYDQWAEMGNQGWSYQEILPYIKRFENVRKLNLKDTSEHGLDGELNIEYEDYDSPIRPFILKSAHQAGIRSTDINGKHQIGISPTQFMTRNGRRLSGANAFLFPVLSRPNLHVAKNTFVTKVVIDPETKVATGVEVVVANETQIIKANKEVIVSAGATVSPKILMLSGVGPREHLQEFNIDVIKDLPVGKFLKDHVTFFGLNFQVENLPKVDSSFPFLNYFLYGKGMFTVPANVTLISYINVGSPDVPSDVPDMEFAISGPHPAAALKLITAEYKEDLAKDLLKNFDDREFFNIKPIIVKPKSFGRVELNSADPFEMPKIILNYYDDPTDLDTMVKGIRKGIEVGMGTPLQELSVTFPKFMLKPCKKFAFNSDNFWKCVVKLFPISVYHPIGTCKMGPKKDKTAVVDPKLRVKGIKGLRVVDASIIPEAISAHPTATCYMIGSKAADLIKETYGMGSQGEY